MADYHQDAMVQKSLTRSKCGRCRFACKWGHGGRAATLRYAFLGGRAVAADYATGAGNGNSRALILLEERGIVRFHKMAVAIRTGKSPSCGAPPVLATAIQPSWRYLAAKYGAPS